MKTPTLYRPAPPARSRSRRRPQTSDGMGWVLPTVILGLLTFWVGLGLLTSHLMR